MSGCKLCLLEHAAAGDDVLGSVCVELEQAKQEIERLRARIAELEERRSETAAMCSQLEADVNTYQKAAAYWWTQYWVAKGMNPPPPRTTDTNWKVIMDGACAAQKQIEELEAILSEYHTDSRCGSCGGPLDAWRDAVCEKCSLKIDYAATCERIAELEAALRDIAGTDGCECDSYEGHVCLMCKVRDSAAKAKEGRDE